MRMSKKFIAYITSFVMCLTILPTVYAADEYRVYLGIYSASQVATSEPLASKTTTKKTDYVSVFTSKRLSVGTTDGGRKLADTFKYLVVKAQVNPDNDVNALYLGRSSNVRVSEKLGAESGWTADNWNVLEFVCEYNSDESSDGKAAYNIDAYVNGTLTASSLSYFVDNSSGDMDIRLVFDCNEGGGTLYWGQIDAYVTNDVPQVSDDKEYRDEENFTIEGYELNTKGAPYTVGELLEQINNPEDGITANVMPTGKVKKEDAASEKSVIENGWSLVTVNSVDKVKKVYKINTGWEYIKKDRSGESFSSVLSTSGVLGKAEDDVLSYADAQGVITETKSEFASKDSNMRYFLASVLFAPEEILTKISIENADFTEISDGFTYGEWNNVLYVYDTSDKKLDAYINGRKVIDGVSGDLALGGENVSVCFEHTGKIYLDDLVAYYCAVPSESQLIPNVTGAVYDVILFDDGETAEYIKCNNGTVSVYTNSTFSERLSDSAPLKTGYVVCCVSSDGVYKYYSLLNKADLNKQYSSLGIGILYNSDTKTLSFNGTLSSENKKSINFIAKSIYSDEDMLYLNFSSADGGNVDYSVNLSEKYTNRRYIYTLSTDFVNETGYLITVSDTTLKNFVEGKINTAKNAEEVEGYLKNNKSEFGFDDGNKGKNFKYMAELIFNMRPENLYNAESFKNAYMISEGLNYVQSGDITFAQFLSSYSSYLDVDYIGKYSLLDDAKKASMQLIFAHGITFENFAKAYEDSLLVSDYISAKTVPNLKEIFVKMCGGVIPDGDYSKIKNEYYEEKVFERMFLNRASCYSTKDINASFEKSVAEVLSEMGNGSSGGSGSSGGTKSSGGNISVAPGTALPSAESDNFSDISSHWAKDSINSLYKKGIISGYGDNTFRPENNVTRAEFVKIMMSILNENADANVEFSDVPDGYWGKKYILSAAAMGLVKGNGNEFLPDNAISRQDAAVILCRAFEYKKIEQSTKKEVSYNDYESIADYAKDKVMFLSQIGIFEGSEGIFSPNGILTRAQAAAIFERSFKYLQAEGSGI